MPELHRICANGGVLVHIDIPLLQIMRPARLVYQNPKIEFFENDFPPMSFACRATFGSADNQIAVTYGMLRKTYS